MADCSARPRNALRRRAGRQRRFEYIRQIATTAANRLFLVGVVLLPVMQVRWSVASVEVIPADVAFGLAFVASLVAMAGGGLSWRWDRLLTAVALFVVAMVVALVAGGITRETLGGAAIGTYVVGLAVLAFWLVPAVVSPESLLRALLLGGMVAASTALVGVGLYYGGYDRPGENRLIGGYGSVPPGDFPRVHGSFLSPNLLCNFLIVAVAAAFGAWALGLVRRRVAIAILASLVAAAIFTLSPGLGGIFFVVALCTWAFASVVPSRALRRSVVAIGTVGSVGFLALTLVELDFSTGVHVSDRVHTWQDAAQRFVDSPIFGVGLDEDLADVESVQPSGVDRRLTDAHNVWLSVAGQMGMLGLVPFVALMVAPFLGPERRSRLTQAPACVALAIALLGAVAYHGLSMSVEDTRHIWVLLGAPAGMVARPARLTTSGELDHVRRGEVHEGRAARRAARARA